MTISLEQVNRASAGEALALLDGLYEHSPWVAEKALSSRPYKSLGHLKHALTQVVNAVPAADQIKLLCAHPELAGKAMLDDALTTESANEQSTAGLTNCTLQEMATLAGLNKQYFTKFGFPFILAVRGTSKVEPALISMRGGMLLTPRRSASLMPTRLAASPTLSVAGATQAVQLAY